MGLILECHALPPDADALDDPRTSGLLLTSVSINSAAVESMLAPLVNGPLAGIDLTADGPVGVRVEPGALAALKARMHAAAVDADIRNALSDGADEALARQSALWIGLA